MIPNDKRSKERGYVACYSTLVSTLKWRDGSAVGGADGRRGGRRVPVGAGGEDVVAAEVVARESEVLCAQRTVGLLDRTEMALRSSCRNRRNGQRCGGGLR